ncbi:DUF4446 family protein [Paenibacillus turpanensis]|uniref:DUF4446 family protein n=1 Tax=Paenibacillus turpanensis TaxID=2689078 RepID=UPI00140D449E|nr:DUF4446 family protein [Paenibacillus turpanensis]
MEAFIEEIIAALILLSAVLCIAVIGLWRQGASLKRKLTGLIGHSGVTNLDEAIHELRQRIEKVEQLTVKQTNQLDTLNGTLKTMKGKAAMIRYNAFADHGNNQSFSLAVVNELQDGYVLSGIRGREESYVYAKPLVKGESPFHLSPEEKEAIRQALATE